MHPSDSLSSVSSLCLQENGKFIFVPLESTPLFFRSPFLIRLDEKKKKKKGTLNYESVNGELRQSEIGFFDRWRNVSCREALTRLRRRLGEIMTSVNSWFLVAAYIHWDSMYVHGLRMLFYLSYRVFRFFPRIGQAHLRQIDLIRFSEFLGYVALLGKSRWNS